jgi:hypothetical protein
MSNRPEVQNFTVRIQTGNASVVERIADPWRQLCDESGDEEIFYRPEWALAYLQAFNSSAEVIVISVWKGERLRGVLPLVRHISHAYGVPVTKLSLPANIHSLRASLTVCSGTEGDAALSAMMQAVGELPKWDVMDVANVVGGSGMDRFLKLATDEGFPTATKRTSQTLYVPISEIISAKPDGQPPWLAGTRPKFRSHLRRSRKQLEELGALKLHHFHKADAEALQKFYALEASGWKGKEGTAIRCDPRTKQFYDLVAQAAARYGYLSLDFLELDGQPIAAHFGFNLRGRYFLCKAGYNESFRRQGPGQLLVHEVLSETLERGLWEFDFVGPATWDESRWASARRTNYRIFIYNRTPYARLLYFLRIKLREKLHLITGRDDNESVPLELRSKPQGSEKESDNNS